MPYFDCAETDKAVASYFKRLRREGVPESAWVQPNRHETRREGDLVNIATGGRLLASYRVLDSGGLRRRRLSDRTREMIGSTI